MEFLVRNRKISLIRGCANICGRFYHYSLANSVKMWRTNNVLYLIIIFCLLELASSSFKYWAAATGECVRNPRKARMSRPKFKVDVVEAKTLIPLAADVSKLLVKYSGPLSVNKSTEAPSFRFLPWWKCTTRWWIRPKSNTHQCRIKKSERREIIYQHLLERLSLSDEKKKEELMGPKKTPMTQHDCYLEAHSTFMGLCSYHYFDDADIRRIKTLLARACESDWLSTSTIVKVLIRTCRQNFRHNNITRSNTANRIFITKSYWPSIPERRDVIHVYLLQVFSKYDDEKSAILSNVTVGPPVLKGNCYLTTNNFFMLHCYYEYYQHGGLKRMRKLLAQACSVEWLNTDKITHVLQTCCRQRFQFVKFDNL